MMEMRDLDVEWGRFLLLGGFGSLLIFRLQSVTLFSGFYCGHFVAEVFSLKYVSLFYVFDEFQGRKRFFFCLRTFFTLIQVIS